MRATRILRRGRQLGESLMDSTVRIRRQGPEVRNPETGMVEQSWITVYEGEARIRFSLGQPREADQAGQRFSEQSPTVWLPIATSSTVRVDDEGEVTGNPHDVGVVGVRFRVSGTHFQTHSTTRRLPVKVLNFT